MTNKSWSIMRNTNRMKEIILFVLFLSVIVKNTLLHFVLTSHTKSRSFRSAHVLFVYLIKHRRINTLCTNIISIITCRVEFIVTFRHLFESVYCFWRSLVSALFQIQQYRLQNNGTNAHCFVMFYVPHKTVLIH